MGDSPTNPPKSGQLTKHLYLTPQESPPHSQVRAGGKKTNKLFSLSQHRHASQCKGHNTSEHRATRACGVFTASPGAHTHQPCKPLDLPCHSVHSELHDKSRQAFAHYAHSGRVLVCGDARCVTVHLILCSKTARSPRGPPARSRMLEKGGGLPHQSPQQPCSSRPHRSGWGPPSHAHNSATWSETGHPAKPARSFKRATAHHRGNPSQAPSRRPTGDTPRAN